MKIWMENQLSKSGFYVLVWTLWAVAFVASCWLEIFIMITCWATLYALLMPILWLKSTYCPDAYLQAKLKAPITV